MNLLYIIELNGWAILGIVVALIFIASYIFNTINDFKNERNLKAIKEVQQEGLIREKELIIQKIQTEMKGQAQDLAIIQFEEWKKTELQSYIKIITQSATKEAEASLQQWILENGQRLRDDAVKRSMAVNLGKITEHLIPFSAQFTEREFNPQDARFVGSPIDLILFDGVASKKPEVTIYFIEVKTGTSALTDAQRKIRLAIADHRVEWLELKKGEFSWETPPPETS